jgi:aryl-alcohol dehydrogenase-like predicted oxidoreductase
MKKRKLGQHGPHVSAIGLGCMGMSEFYGPHDDRQSLDTLAHALDLGIDFLDTADMYGRGHNEELIGKFLRTTKKHVVVASKVGIVREASGYGRRVDNSSHHIFSACDASLHRLGIERIDLYYLHRLDPSALLDTTMETMAELVRDGKVGHVGLCECSEDTLRRAHKIHPIAAVQSEYSLWTRDPEDGVLKACRELGIAFVAYSPLGRGFLSGKLNDTSGFAPDDFRRMNPRFQGDNFFRNRKALNALAAFAGEKRCSLAQLALAWLLAQGDAIIPIPGTKRRLYLDENAKATEIHLAPADLRQIDKILPRNFVAGARYTPEGMKGVNV